MSKEAMERILRAEEEAKNLVLKAEQDAEECFKNAEAEIEKERIAFNEKLKSERNEKTRRAYMQTQVSGEEAKIQAEKAYHLARKEYEDKKESAIIAAIEAVFK